MSASGLDDMVGTYSRNAEIGQSSMRALWTLGEVQGPIISLSTRPWLRLTSSLSVLSGEIPGSVSAGRGRDDTDGDRGTDGPAIFDPLCADDDAEILGGRDLEAVGIAVDAGVCEGRVGSGMTLRLALGVDATGALVWSVASIDDCTVGSSSTTVPRVEEEDWTAVAGGMPGCLVRSATGGLDLC